MGPRERDQSGRVFCDRILGRAHVPVQKQRKPLVSAFAVRGVAGTRGDSRRTLEVGGTLCTRCHWRRIRSLVQTRTRVSHPRGQHTDGSRPCEQQESGGVPDESLTNRCVTNTRTPQKEVGPGVRIQLAATRMRCGGLVEVFCLW